MLHTVVVLCSFAATIAELNPATCIPGQTEVSNFVKSRCVSAGHVEDVGCVAPNGEEVMIDHTTDDGNFRYICLREGDNVRFFANGNHLDVVRQNFIINHSSNDYEKRLVFNFETKLFIRYD